MRHLTRPECVKMIDKGVKNEFRCQWLDEKDLCGIVIEKWCTKVDRRGVVFCNVCGQYDLYGGAGLKDIRQHTRTRKDGSNPHLEAYRHSCPTRSYREWLRILMNPR